MGQSHIFVTADLPIYAKAKEILWNKPSALHNKVTMRLGMMHLVMAMMAGIGKLYADGGLHAMLVDTNVYADATARLMLQGKEISRGIRGLKLVVEALMGLLIREASDFFGDELNTQRLTDLIASINDAFQRKDIHSAKLLCATLEHEVDPLQDKIVQFITIGKKRSNTFTYWCNFLQFAGVVMNIMRADREADFKLHLEATSEAIPWLRASGRMSYAKFTPVYLSEMLDLEKHNQEAFRHLSSGGFVVRRSSSKFNCVPTDQALEQTINRECKGRGGVIGFTLKKSALVRWLLTRHIAAEYASAVHDLCTLSEGVRDFDSSTFTSQRDANDVREIRSAIEDQWQNPFRLKDIKETNLNKSSSFTPERLINITTVMQARADVENDLINCIDRSKKRCEEFLNRKFQDSPDRQSFWTPDPRFKVLTFLDMKHVTKINNTTIQADAEVLFRRLLAVSKQRNISLQYVLSFELSGIPISMFHNDGTMRKTSKADLAKKIQESAPVEQSLCSTETHSTLIIIDGMAFIREISEQMFRTFSDLALLLRNRIINILKGDMQVSTCVLVFDRYDRESSVKDAERVRRYGDVESPTYKITASRDVPKLSKFLGSSSKKQQLIAFLCDQLEILLVPSLTFGASVILPGGYNDGLLCKQVTSSGIEVLTNMSCNHEEADTRMILHAVHPPSGTSRLIIKSDDTDVLILLLYRMAVGELHEDTYMLLGHSSKSTNKQPFLDISAICFALGRGICRALPAAHAITGRTQPRLYRVLGRELSSRHYTK